MSFREISSSTSGVRRGAGSGWYLERKFLCSRRGMRAVGGTCTVGGYRSGCGSVEAVAGGDEVEGRAEEDEGCDCGAGVGVGVFESVEGD